MTGWLRAAALGAMVTLGMAAADAARANGGHDWSGFYVGGHAGIAWSDASATDLTLPGGGFFSFGPPLNVFGFDSDGFIGGAQIGYQRQFGYWLLGAEASYSWAGLSQTIRSPFFPASDEERLEIGPIFMATARLGYAADHWLLYVKGGYAGGDVEFRAFDRVNNVGYSQSSWQHGWTIGGGIEYAISQRVTLGLEYNFIDLGADGGTGLNTGGGPESYRLEAEVHAVTARLNLLFGHHHRHHHDPVK
jgi:outer membrane immunogenic protein